MDPYGQIWGAPFPYYGQTGAFIAQQAPPSTGPFDGTLVALPCLNPDWLRIVLGALDVLRNPSNWAPVDESSLLTVLQRVDELKGVLSLGGACVNPVVSLSLDSCVLNAHLADGSTIVPVTGWEANFCSCVRGCIPQPPSNPKGTPTDQLACNIAGFLATEIIQVACQKAITYAQLESQLVLYSVSLSNELAFLFPLVNVATNAFAEFFIPYISGVIGHYESAASDDVYWARVTCAIFGAIRAVGYPDQSNYAAIEAAVCATSSGFGDVDASVCALINNIGWQNLEGAAQSGALDDVDCAGCGTWCHEWDFTTSSAGWAPVLGSEVYVPGVGWQTGYVSADNRQEGRWALTPPSDCINFGTTWCVIHGDGSTVLDNIMQFLNGGVVDAHCTFSLGTDPTSCQNGPTGGCGPVPGPYDTIYLTLEASGDVEPLNLSNIRFSGTGVNPFGVNNCT